MIFYDIFTRNGKKHLVVEWLSWLPCKYDFINSTILEAYKDITSTLPSLMLLEQRVHELVGGSLNPPDNIVGSKSLRSGRVRMYSMGACATLGMSNQDALSKDLESDPFLNSNLQRFTCKLYYRFGSFLAFLIIRLITSRHYLLEWNVIGTKNCGTNGPEERDKQTASK